MAYTTEVDHVVVGAGVMGAATAYALARSGRQVVLVDRYVPGHANGSSHGRTRIFRLSYPDPEYVDMAQRALRLWRQLEQDAGEELLRTTGGFDLGSGVAANASALEAAGAAFEQLTPLQAARRFPTIAFTGPEPVLYQPDAGVIAAERTVGAFLRLATHHGAQVRVPERVRELDPGADSVVVHTERGVIKARRVVVTAGAWAAPLVASVGIDLPVRVTRETVCYFEVQGEAPPPLVEWGDPALYSLPSPGQGLKAAQHGAGPEVDPESAAQPSARAIEIVSAWVQERFRHAGASPQLVETCLYTNTSDERFILERHGPVVVGSPCSGHGFKFAPLIGQRLANLAEGFDA